MSNSYSKRRGKLPKPAVCISKKKHFSNPDRKWPVPEVITGTVTLAVTPCGEDPSDRITTLQLYHKKNTLDWSGDGVEDGIQTFMTATYDTRKPGWSCVASAVWSDPISPSGEASISGEMLTFPPGLTTTYFLEVTGDWPPMTDFIAALSYPTDFGNKKG